MTDYLGQLPGDDPLYRYLQAEILPQLGSDGSGAEFGVFRVDGRRRVYFYEEQRSGIRVVGKFFGGPDYPGSPEAVRRMEREYWNLHLLRGYGLGGYPHQVIRP